MRSLFALSILSLVFAGCVDEDLGGIVTPVTQVHHQGGGAADLLFVIDSSLSMAEEQRALGDGFNTFIDGFVALQYDFRIAVTTMDVINDGGALRGPVLAPDTPNLGDRFREQVNVGVNGLGIEQGLEGAKRALDNLTTADFLREDATLTIIFVSDEDDQSPSTLEHYLDFFVRKKSGDARRVRISAITGPRTGGCSEASPGLRYLDLVEQTGGASESICRSDLGLGDLGAEISGFKTSFPLQQHVDEGEPVVFVDGVEVTSGVSFEGDQVRFTRGSEPGQCAVVEIAYFTRDFTDTGGEPVVLEPTPAVCQNLEFNERQNGIQGGCSQAGGAAWWMSLLGLGLWVRRMRT